MQVAMPTKSRGAEKLQFRNGGAAELYDVEDPGPNDVLFGRGTGSNMHTGNIRFRALIQKYKPIYRDTPKKMKPSVSTKVVNIWRAQDPPGRFLTRSDRFHGSRRTFYDVGDAMARRKAAQCLREKSSKERHVEEQPTGAALVEEADGTVVAMPTGLVEDPTVSSSGAEVQQLENLAAELFGASPSPLSSSSSSSGTTITNASNEFLNEDFVMPDIHSLNTSSIISPFKPMELPGLDSALELLPASLKTLASKYNSLDCDTTNKTKNDHQHLLSLMDVYAAETGDSFAIGEERHGNESPFLFASFDLGSSGNTDEAENNNADQDNQDDTGGLCFPSLLGDSTPGSSPLFESDAEDDSPLFPSLPSLALPITDQTKPDSLQIIRDAMPTAAALVTTNLFDF